MISRSLLLITLLNCRTAGQTKEPVFYSWHVFEYAAYEKVEHELTLQLHFRTRDRFSTFSLLRLSVFGSQRLPHGWIWAAGYLRQNYESIGDSEWVRQHRLFSSFSRPLRRGRFVHVPRVQYDYLFGMSTPAYGRYRFSWQTELAGRFRPYAGIEEFVEHAGRQRSRPRAGVRFSPTTYLDADIAYIYDHIYLRGNGNRHILQTSFNFHRPATN